MAKLITFAFMTEQPFTVSVGDKVVLVSSRRSPFGDRNELPPPDLRQIAEVAAIRGGKQPRIELKDSGNTFDAAGQSSWGGYRIEKYDAQTESNHAAASKNYDETVQVAGKLARLNTCDWQRICSDETLRREILQLLGSHFKA